MTDESVIKCLTNFINSNSSERMGNWTFLSHLIPRLFQ